uniref:Uncharacterized protein n=1 Tax=Oryza punctata TaxID=4537 RepID=A0A0E0LV36_ORYPU
MMDRTGSCQQANPAAGESRASHHLPHHHGRRRRRHRALLGGAASIAHPSPLGLISGSLHFLRVLLKILPSLSTLTGIADSVYLLRLQKQGSHWEGKQSNKPRWAQLSCIKTHPISTCYPDEGTRRKEKEVSVADRDSSNPSRLLHAHFTQESTLQTAPYAAAAGQQLPWSDFSIAFSLLNFRLLLRFWLRFDALSDL